MPDRPRRVRPPARPAAALGRRRDHRRHATGGVGYCQGYRITGAYPVQLTRLHLRALWYGNWHRATPQSAAVWPTGWPACRSRCCWSSPIRRRHRGVGPSDRPEGPRRPGAAPTRAITIGAVGRDVSAQPRALHRRPLTMSLRELGPVRRTRTLSEVVLGARLPGDASAGALRLADRVESGVRRRGGDLDADAAWAGNCRRRPRWRGRRPLRRRGWALADAQRHGILDIWTPGHRVRLPADAPDMIPAELVRTRPARCCSRSPPMPESGWLALGCPTASLHGDATGRQSGYHDRLLILTFRQGCIAVGHLGYAVPPDFHSCGASLRVRGPMAPAALESSRRDGRHTDDDPPGVPASPRRGRQRSDHRGERPPRRHRRDGELSAGFNWMPEARWQQLRAGSTWSQARKAPSRSGGGGPAPGGQCGDRLAGAAPRRLGVRTGPGGPRQPDLSTTRWITCQAGCSSKPAASWPGRASGTQAATVLGPSRLRWVVPLLRRTATRLRRRSPGTRTTAAGLAAKSTSLAGSGPASLWVRDGPGVQTARGSGEPGIAGFLVERCLPVYPVLLTLCMRGESLTSVIVDSVRGVPPPTPPIKVVLCRPPVPSCGWPTTRRIWTTTAATTRPGRWSADRSPSADSVPPPIPACRRCARDGRRTLPVVARPDGSCAVYGLALYGRAEAVAPLLRDNALANLAARPVQFLITGFRHDRRSRPGDAPGRQLHSSRWYSPARCCTPRSPARLTGIPVRPARPALLLSALMGPTASAGIACDSGSSRSAPAAGQHAVEPGPAAGVAAAGDRRAAAAGVVAIPTHRRAGLSAVPPTVFVLALLECRRAGPRYRTRTTVSDAERLPLERPVCPPRTARTLACGQWRPGRNPSATNIFRRMSRPFRLPLRQGPRRQGRLTRYR